MPSLSPGLIRRWRALTERVRDGADIDQADRLEAAFVLQKLPARRVVKTMRRERVAGEKAEREGRRDRMAGIVAAVRERSGGLCEVCRLAPAVEVHHIRSGPERRMHERAETCIDLCRVCHRGAHRNDEGTLELMASWAEAHDFVAAAMAIDRRLRKIRDTAALLVRRPA